MKLDKDDEWHYVLGLTATRPHAHDDSRSSCSGWWDSLGDWHDQDSWFSHFRNRSSWSEGECSDDWRDYRSGHHHHARDEKAWNFFYEEFETVGYLIDSEWSFPESTCDVEDWLSEYSADLSCIMNEVKEAADGLINYERSANCPWKWTLTDSDGDEVDSDRVYFDGDNHVFAFNADKEGEWKFRLCANNDFNGDFACTDVKIEVEC